MTTKPKAKKFRIKRSGPDWPTQGEPDKTPPKKKVFDQPEDGFGSEPFPGSAKADAKDGEIAEIRKEGLTGRQLRMARRLAQKHGLTPTSDFDAVRLLRARGIDPFKREAMLELVGGGDDEQKESKVPAPTAQLPQTVPAEAPVPGPVSDAARIRSDEVFRLQADISRRRRRKMWGLVARLFVFVLIPTLIAGYYFTSVATPMYGTKSEFVIQQADGAASPMGGLFSGTGLATSQDSVTVQSFLQSREALLRLDADEGFKAHFSGPNIDPLTRLSADASNEDAYALYRKLVTIGYDPTEGLIRMEVVAADPDVSAAFSTALIGYAEEQVDTLSLRLRESQMADATESFADAEAKMIAAQERVLTLQEQLGVLDPTSETAAQMSQIAAFETQLAEKRLQLLQLLDNEQPNQARVAGVQGDIERLEVLIAELRSELTQANEGATSLARITSELRMAEVDLETRTLMMQESLQQVETARIEANRQVRYLSLGVSPVPPDEPTYPRPFENTLLAFLIFSGIYLMISITVSILRDQV
ncbi:MAG: capsule biosynthesis protein [Rhodobacteraceae bacterium]|nr:capsule biosynthesis protein [Paracoccaceae bacterium]